MTRIETVPGLSGSNTFDPPLSHEVGERHRCGSALRQRIAIGGACKPWIRQLHVEPASGSWKAVRVDVIRWRDHEILPRQVAGVVVHRLDGLPGAGNAGRAFDLETERRIAEFQFFGATAAMFGAYDRARLCQSDCGVGQD